MPVEGEHPSEEILPEGRRHELTGLPNQVVMREQLAHAVETMPGNFALILGDLNDLKYINETDGHPAGDEYIRGFGTWVRERMRKSDEVFFYASHEGGDEFHFLLHDVSSQEEVDRFKRRMLADLEPTPYSISMGGRVHQLGESSDELVVACDKLAQLAKQESKLEKYNRIQHFIARTAMTVVMRAGIRLRDLTALNEAYKRRRNSR